MTCIWCHEEVLPGEGPPSLPKLTGLAAQTQGGVVDGEQVTQENVHKECLIRMVSGSKGHILKKCSCYGGTEEDPPEMTLRQAAVAAAEAYYETTKAEVMARIDRVIEQTDQTQSFAA